MPRYFVKSYTDAGAAEKRFAVERQDGSIHRVLQRDFVTQEGASEWLARYEEIKKHKGNRLERDTARRTRARQSDPERLGTALPSPEIARGVTSNRDPARSMRRTTQSTSLKPREKRVRLARKVCHKCWMRSVQFAKDTAASVPFLLGATAEKAGAAPLSLYMVC